MDPEPLVIYRDVGEVEAAVAEAVAAVPLTRWTSAWGADDVDHSQGGSVWAESDLPLTATRPTSGRHLEFSVSIEDAPAASRAASRAPLGEVLVPADLAIVFWYRLRSGSKRRDTRAAAALAHDVVRWLAHAGPADVDLDPVRVFRPGRPLAQAWYPVEIRLRATFALTLSQLG